MRMYESIMGGNNAARELQNLLIADGPASITLHNHGDEEFILSMIRQGNTLATAFDSKYQVTGQTLVHLVAGLALTQTGFMKGNTAITNGAIMHPDLLLQSGVAQGTTSAAATRQLDDTVGGANDFQASGVQPGDIVEINDAGTPNDNGTYRIVTVDTANRVTVERNWPAGAQTPVDFWFHERCCVMPWSLALTVSAASLDAVIVAVDDGAGAIVGAGTSGAGANVEAVTGTIDYFSGLWTMTYSDVAADGALNAAVLATYAETLPVVPGGKITFPVRNCRRAVPITLLGAGDGETVVCGVTVQTGV